MAKRHRRAKKSSKSKKSACKNELAALISAHAAEGKKLSDHRPKNIIFCVADGMAMSTVTMSNYYQQITLGHPSYWGSLIDAEYVVNGLQSTRSLNSLVTDSAAASSSWGSGRATGAGAGPLASPNERIRWPTLNFSPGLT